jgi:hypothetical protein
MSNCEEIFTDFFMEYCEIMDKPGLSLRITSRDREGDINPSPHALPGNAIDITLKNNGNFAPIREYNELFKYMIDNWLFRAGIDNTERVTEAGKHPNVHIHVDLGGNRPRNKQTGELQKMPFFFEEDNGRYKRTITSAADL